MVTTCYSYRLLFVLSVELYNELEQTNHLILLLFSGVQTPNCIRQTVFDAVALDYQSVTVLVDATAAASPEVHHGSRSKPKPSTSAHARCLGYSLHPPS